MNSKSVSFRHRLLLRCHPTNVPRNHFRFRENIRSHFSFCPRTYNQFLLDVEQKDHHIQLVLLLEATKQLVEYGIEIIPDEFGEKETLRKAIQHIKWRDKVLDLVLSLESDEVENYADY